MTDAATWWRIELNVNGKILTTRRVESSEINSKTVVYVQAFHEIDARTEARKAYNAYMRAAMMRRRKRLIAEGKCGWCGEHNDRDPEKRCTVCVGRELNYNKRRRDKAAGRTVPKLDRSTVLAERRERLDKSLVENAVAGAATSHRLQVLQEVQQAWLENRTVGAFSMWLNGEIAKLSNAKRVA
jgi:hypothetical protein